MKLTSLVILLMMNLAACSQQDSVTQAVHLLKAGESVIKVEQIKHHPASEWLLLHLHSNEVTAYRMGKRFAMAAGVDFVSIQNNEERNVPFYFESRLFAFDPNRIFSDTGLTKTIQPMILPFGEVHQRIKEFSNSLLALIDTSKTVVAIHNNTNNNFSLLTYIKDGSGKVHQNPAQDHDDFFITNDEEVFGFLKQRNFNVVKEDVSKLEEDGSFSLYATRNNIRYVNIEAEHHHDEEQWNMLKVLFEFLNGKKK